MGFNLGFKGLTMENCHSHLQTQSYLWTAILGWWWLAKCVCAPVRILPIWGWHLHVTCFQMNVLIFLPLPHFWPPQKNCCHGIWVIHVVGFDMYMSYGWGLLVKTWRQICPTKRDVRALHDVTSDMSHERHDFVTWLLRANAHPASRISQYDNSHPVRCFWILLEFRNAIVRVRSRVIRDMIIELQSVFDASGYFSSSTIPLCACPVTCNSRYDNWTLIGRMCTTWPSNLNVTR